MIDNDATRDRSTHYQRYFSKAGLTPAKVPTVLAVTACRTNERWASLP